MTGVILIMFAGPRRQKIHNAKNLPGGNFQIHTSCVYLWKKVRDEHISIATTNPSPSLSPYTQKHHTITTNQTISFPLRCLLLYLLQAPPDDITGPEPVGDFVAGCPKALLTIEQVENKALE